MKKKYDFDRRVFLQKASLIVVAFAGFSLLSPFSRSFAKAKKKKKEEALPSGMHAVPESDPVATAIGYKANIKDIDYKKFPQRKKAAAKNQFCKSCALYTEVNASWGKCQMITAGLVHADGWCGSWTKKS